MNKEISTGDAKILISSIIEDNKQLLIIGRGALYRKMKAYLFGRYRIDINKVASYSSFEAPISDEILYVVAASPSSEVCNILIEKGVKKENIVLWLGVLKALENDNSNWLLNHYGLLPFEDMDKPYVNKNDVTFDADVFLFIKSALKKWLLVNDTTDGSHKFNLTQIEQLSSIYLKLRLDLFQLTQIPAKKLLFPSTGRCGGTSITSALNSIELNLHVSHEGYSTEIYNLLKCKYQFGFSEQVMQAITSIVLDESDCLGGNPICFLSPYVGSLPWFECAVIKVSRNKSDLISSITDRNFHYSKMDFVPNRITACITGEMSEEEWAKLKRVEKIDWYINQVDRAIVQNKANYAYYYEVDFSELDSAMNEVLNALSWCKEGVIIPHLNALQKDKVYSFDDRVKLFREQNSDASTP